MERIQIPAHQPFQAFMEVESYPNVACTLMLIGFFFTLLFFKYELTHTNKTRELKRELMLSASASAFLGSGSLFLFLWGGLYV